MNEWLNVFFHDFVINNNFLKIYKPGEKELMDGCIALFSGQLY
jgi:hypothetical protein